MSAGRFRERSSPRLELSGHGPGLTLQISGPVLRPGPGGAARARCRSARSVAHGGSGPGYGPVRPPTGNPHPRRSSVEAAAARPLTVTHPSHGRLRPRPGHPSPQARLVAWSARDEDWQLRRVPAARLPADTVQPHRRLRDRDRHRHGGGLCQRDQQTGTPRRRSWASQLPLSLAVPHLPGSHAPSLAESPPEQDS